MSCIFDKYSLETISLVSKLFLGDDLIKFILEDLSNILNSDDVKILLRDKNISVETVNGFNDAFSIIKLQLSIVNETVQSKSLSIDINFSEILNSLQEFLNIQFDDDVHCVEKSYEIINNVITLLFKISFSSQSFVNINLLFDFYRHNLNIKNFTIKTKKLQSFHLKTIHSIINLYLEICEEKSNKTELFVNVSHRNFYLENNFFSKIILKLEDNLLSEVLLIISKYFFITNDYTILHLVWNEVSYFTRKKEFYIIINSFFNYFLNENNKIDLFNDKKFWLFVQNGLVSEDDYIRKNALKLLKKSIEIINLNNLTICISDINNDFSNSYINESINNFYFISNEDSKNIMYWESNSKEEFYSWFEMIIGIIECLEEKQAHISKPIFKLVLKLIEINQNGKGLNISWIIVIFQRILNNSNLSIVKWGVENLLTINLKFPNDNILTIVVVRLLLKSLNNVSLYASNRKSLDELLKKYLLRYINSQDSKIFFKMFLTELCHIKWGVEPLFCILHVIYDILNSNQFKIDHSNRIQWDNNDLQIVKLFGTDSIRTNYTNFRVAFKFYLLYYLIAFSSGSDQLENIVDIFAFFYVEETPSKLTHISPVTDLIKKIFSSEEIEKVVIKYFTFNSNFNFNVFYLSKVIFLFDKLNVLNRDLTDKIQLALKTISRSVSEQNISSKNDYNVALLSLLSEKYSELDLKNVINYIILQISGIKRFSDIESLKIYLYIFETCLVSLRTEESRWILEIIKNYLENQNKDSINNYKKLKIISLISKYDYFHSIIDKSFFYDITSLIEDDSLTDNLKHLWGKINSEYIEAYWITLANVNFIIKSDDLIKNCTEALEITDYSLLVPIMSAFSKHIGTTSENVEEVINMMWNNLIESKKSKYFLKSFDAFLDVLISITRDDDSKGLKKTEDIALFYLEKTMEIENNLLIYNYLSSPLFDIHGVNFKSQILSKTLVYGPIISKEEKLLLDCSSNLPGSERGRLVDSKKIRELAVQKLLQDLLTKRDTVGNMADEIVYLLLERMKEFGSTRPYFLDSFEHRVKHRALQVILILQSYLEKEKGISVLTYIFNHFLKSDNQFSVYFMAEWAMIRHLYNEDNWIDEVTDEINNFSKSKNHVRKFILTLKYHEILKLLADEETDVVNVISKLSNFLPFCSSGNASFRLHAQVLLDNLLVAIEGTGYSHDIFPKIRNALNTSRMWGNYQEYFLNAKKDFYYRYHPVKHFTLENIFYHVTRLSKISIEECKSIDKVIHNLWIELEGPENHFSMEKFESLIIPTEHVVIDEESNENIFNFQKKIIPDDSLKKEKPYTDGLIVVATLLSDISSMGAVCRTCEIFGVSSYSIPDIRFINDKRFQSLSMTSEKWLHIEEVNFTNLYGYLMLKKNKGYIIVAAKQSDSQPLNKFKFPKKSILLLGNETGEIPSNLLHIVDIWCIIPRCGVTTSLNSHVTSALLIWEYATQHSF